MSNVPKELWPQAFHEGKTVAEHVLALNRELKKFARQKPDGIPTDRELTLAAAVNIFWEYRLGQEASHAARILTWDKIEAYIVEVQAYVGEPNDLNGRRLLKTIRRLKNNEAANGFLNMWVHLEKFMGAAVADDFWTQYDKPSTAVKALVADLGLLAKLGEESNGQKHEEGSNNGSPEGQEGSQGVPDRPLGAANPAEGKGSSEARPGFDAGGGGVQGSGGRVESEEGRPQEPGEEPQRGPEEDQRGDRDQAGQGH